MHFAGRAVFASSLNPECPMSSYCNPRKYFWGLDAGATGKGEGTLVIAVYGPVTIGADCREPYGQVTTYPFGGPSKLNRSFNEVASTTAPPNAWPISEG